MIFHLSFTLDQQIWQLKKMLLFLEIDGKWIIIQGGKSNLLSKTFAHFWPFLKALADKLMAHSQISFKSWLNNVASELHFFLLKIMLCWLQNVGFQTAWTSPKPWTKLNVWQQEHFWPLLKVPEEKLMPPSQISFKSWWNNVDSELYFVFSKKCNGDLITIV